MDFDRVLRHEGYEVDVAHDGLSALRSIEARMPDLVLLDVVIPGLSGLDLCRRLKHDQATRLLPVVLVTGHDEHVCDRCLEDYPPADDA